jgi:hypothetical protein
VTQSERSLSFELFLKVFMSKVLSFLNRISVTVEYINKTNKNFTVINALEPYFEKLCKNCELSESDLLNIRKFKNNSNESERSLWVTSSKVAFSIPNVLKTLYAHMTHSEKIWNKLLAASILTALLSIQTYSSIISCDNSTFVAFNHVLRQSSNLNYSNTKQNSEHATLWLPLLLGELQDLVCHDSMCKTIDNLELLIETLLILASLTSDNTVCCLCYDVLRNITAHHITDPYSVMERIFFHISNIVIINDEHFVKLNIKENKRCFEKIRRIALNFIKEIVTADQKMTKIVVVFFRHICLKGCHRSDTRLITIETVLKLIQTITINDQQCFMNFLFDISKTKNNNYRILALEMSGAIFDAIDLFNTQILHLSTSQVKCLRNDNSSINKKIMTFPRHCFLKAICVKLIIKRCLDKV